MTDELNLQGTVALSEADRRRAWAQKREEEYRAIAREFEPLPDCPLVQPFTRFMHVPDEALQHLYTIRKQEPDDPNGFRLPPIPGLNPDLKPRIYQELMAEHMYHMPRFICGDGVGLGKSYDAIIMMTRVRNDLAAKGVCAKVIILTTTSTAYQWESEIKRFSDLKPWVLLDAYKPKDAKKQITGHAARKLQLEKFLAHPRLNVLVCRYSQWLGQRAVLSADTRADSRTLVEAGRELLSTEMLDFREIIGKDQKSRLSLILDETHKVKTPGASGRNFIVAIQARFNKVIAMTATPIKNRLDEFYSIATAIGIAPLLSLQHFIKHVCITKSSWVRGGAAQKVFITGYRPEGVQKFRIAIRPWYWGRTQAQVKEKMPKLSTIMHPVDLDKATMKLLLQDIPSGQYVLPPALKEVAGELILVERDPSNLMTALSVQQICANSTALLDPGNPEVYLRPKLSPKEELLLDLLDNDLEGESVVCFAQPLDTKILTPSGWALMGDLKVGDAVVDPDGGVGYVEGVYPQGVKDIYRVTTRSRAVTRCCADHLWMTMSLSSARSKTPWRVYETRELLRQGTRRFHKNGSTAYRFTLPVAQAPEFKPWAPPIPAYTLGVLLGDGDITRSVTFASMDQEIVDRVSGEVVMGVRLAKHGRGISWGLSATEQSSKDSRGFNIGGNNPYQATLRSLGLLGLGSADKFIPRCYLHCGPEDRLALLQGLMDTDGTHNISNNSCHYVSISHQLALDVAELVRSLGGLATVDGPYINKFQHGGSIKDGAPHWQVQVRLNTCPFHLPRKAALWSPVKVRNPIKDIEPCGQAECQCIRVSTKRNLYITDDYIVTHNTKYRSWIDRLEHLSKNKKFTVRPFLRITGAETGKVREINRRHFQDEPDTYNLITINSAGIEGINLQRAAHMVCLDIPWSWGDLIQLVGRMVRMASPNSACVLHILYACGTVDEYVLEVQRTKKGLFERILGTSGSAGLLDDGEINIDEAMKGLEAEGGDDKFFDLMRAHAKAVGLQPYAFGQILAQENAGMRKGLGTPGMGAAVQEDELLTNW